MLESAGNSKVLAGTPLEYQHRVRRRIMDTLLKDISFHNSDKSSTSPTLTTLSQDLHHSGAKKSLQDSNSSTRHTRQLRKNIEAKPKIEKRAEECKSPVMISWSVAPTSCSGKTKQKPVPLQPQLWWCCQTCRALRRYGATTSSSRSNANWWWTLSLRDVLTSAHFRPIGWDL